MTNKMRIDKRSRFNLQCLFKIQNQTQKLANRVKIIKLSQEKWNNNKKTFFTTKNLNFHSIDIMSKEIKNLKKKSKKAIIFCRGLSLMVKRKEKNSWKFLFQNWININISFNIILPMLKNGTSILTIRALPILFKRLKKCPWLKKLWLMSSVWCRMQFFLTKGFNSTSLLTVEKQKNKIFHFQSKSCNWKS